VIREVVEGAQAGIAVPPGDPQAMAQAIRALAADRPRCLEMGRAGRRCVEEEFNRTAVAEKLLLLLEEMERLHA